MNRKLMTSVAAAVLMLVLLLPIALGLEQPADLPADSAAETPSAGASAPAAVDTAASATGVCATGGSAAQVQDQGSRVASQEGAPPVTPTGEALVAVAAVQDPTAEPDTEESAAEEPTAEGEEAIIMEATRTPVPTATAGPITELVSEITDAAGLARTTFLGLRAEDWINLLVSIVSVAIVSFLAITVVHSLLRRLVRRTQTEFDDRLLEAIGPQIQWLLILYAVRFGVSRLNFVSDSLRQWLYDLLFLAIASVVFLAAWHLLDVAGEWYRQNLPSEEDATRLRPLITLARRAVRIALILVGLTIVLSYFGINVTALTATLGVAGLALSLAAQDTLADMISGLIILLDQPFRVGDRIEISELGTWGDVLEIGTRTTRIRTRDNRMVIVPNSTIGKNQVVNYTFPDPQYRIQMDIGIDYSMDIDRARQVIHDAVRRVPGVLPDKPVDALYNEMGDSAMMFRVRWWIESYEDTRRVYDRVNTALQRAMDANGIVSPFTTLDVNVHVAGTDDQSGTLPLADAGLGGIAPQPGPAAGR